MSINWIRCSFEERSDGIYFCEGLHHRSADCEWQKLTVENIKEILSLSGYNAPVDSNIK